MESRRHRNNFDALRLTAALVVIVAHAFMLSGRVQPTPLGDIYLGTCAVYVFFAISGFLVTTSWRLDPSPVRFLCKRMLRVGPGYVAALGVVGLCMSFVRLDSFTGNPMSDINGSLWTIPYEVQCYLLLVGVAVVTRHAGLVLAAVVVASAGYGQLMPFLALFAAGSAIAEYPILRRPIVLGGAMALGAGIFATGWQETGAALLLAPASIWIGTASWPGLRSVGRGGDISYGVYLYAYPIQQGLVMVLGADRPVLLHMTLTAVLSVAAGIASWRFIERPALALKPRSSPSLDERALPLT